MKQAICYYFAQAVVPELSVNFSQSVLVPEFVSAVRRQTSGEFATILSVSCGIGETISLEKVSLHLF